MIQGTVTVLGNSKNRKTRKNRRKKDLGQLRRRWMARTLTGVKLCGIIAGLLMASAGFMYVYAAVTCSDYFRTEKIRIGGNQRLSEEQVLAQAGIDIGNNLLALNLSLVRKRLIAHPWVADARVAREIPETITIRLVEHEALAQIDLGRRFLINTDGKIFKEVQDAEASGLPLIQGIEYGDISLGEDALNPPMAAVVDVLQSCRKPVSVIPYTEIQELRLDKEMGITIVLKDQERMIQLGFGDLDTKLERFKRLRPVLQGNGKWRSFQMVDLNNPDRVVVRLNASDAQGA
ncbi:cell division protein FtsQ/DivIB [Desulfatitalea tepidiphila]|uniref:cell division protein FtsQ/DivIB n=1 Tax=Desulfatitalea tepidiphila TaxID=1185843 RepID=UPI0006B41087|nr:FtsQ-type POTRA domain-containing protein [Desulfatitalea tepidiphila]